MKLELKKVRPRKWLGLLTIVIGLFSLALSANHGFSALHILPLSMERDFEPIDFSDFFYRVGYLAIVPNDSWKSTVEQKLTWLHPSFNIYVESVASIGSTYSGIDLAQKIWNCVKHYSKDLNVKYLLLCGTQNEIPLRFLDPEVPENTNNGCPIPTDWYYGGFDYSRTGDSWDWDNDGKFGERTESQPGGEQYQPRKCYEMPTPPFQVAVGRIPTSNLATWSLVFSGYPSTVLIR